ncbi:hypothetical protein [Sphingomonas sp.]|uniref:hypothetical protein n=1 Tax=Sphingomonas sp. TaxID=28214 RepID=UPI002FC77256
MTPGEKFIVHRPRLAWPAAHLLAALLLLWIAFANGSPLFFPDSGAYLSVSKLLGYPWDRPPTYGLAIAPFQLAFGLWGVIVAQALFATWVIGVLLERVTGLRSPLALVAAAALLAGASSLPWFVGQLMPDLFTGLTILLIFLLVFAPPDSPRGACLLFVLLLSVLITFHLSHIAIAVLLIPVALFAGVWLGLRRTALIGATQAAIALLLAVLALSMGNWIVRDQFRPALRSEGFLLARLLDAGLAGEVLDRACAERPLGLCAARPAMKHAWRPGQGYLWHEESPREALHRAAPERTRAEEAQIIRRTVAERPADVLRIALRDWLRQLFRGASGDGLEANTVERVALPILREHFPSSAAAWATSLQGNGRLDLLAWPLDRVVALLVGLASPFILLAARRRGDTILAGLTIVIVAALLANAAVCSMLSGVFDRYQARVTWLLPLLAIVAFLRFRLRRSGAS